MSNYSARKKFIVLDTEATNGLDDPLVYDIGYIIADRYGHIYARRSWIIQDVFADRPELMESAYYNYKIPEYIESLSNGERCMCSLYTARKVLKEDIEKYGITDFYAYNARFDVNALNTTQRYFTHSKYRWFLPYGIKVKCIWHMACQLLATQKSFHNMAVQNEWFSPAGNWKTNAEIMYRYIEQLPEFEEEHKGLDDVYIEYAILLKCLRQHKKVDERINRMCWNIPVKKWGKAQA